MGENPEMRKDFGDNQIRRGKTVLFQNISLVPKDQSCHRGSKAYYRVRRHLWPWIQSLMSIEHLHIMRNALTKAINSFMTVLKCCRMTS